MGSNSISQYAQNARNEIASWLAVCGVMTGCIVNNMVTGYNKPKNPDLQWCIGGSELTYLCQNEWKSKKVGRSGESRSVGTPTCGMIAY